MWQCSILLTCLIRLYHPFLSVIRCDSIEGVDLYCMMQFASQSSNCTTIRLWEIKWLAPQLQIIQASTLVSQQALSTALTQHTQNPWMCAAVPRVIYLALLTLRTSPAAWSTPLRFFAESRTETSREVQPVKTPADGQCISCWKTADQDAKRWDTHWWNQQEHYLINFLGEFCLLVI